MNQEGYHKWLNREHHRSSRIKFVWSFLFCSFGCWQSRRNPQEAWKHSNLQKKVNFILKSPENCLLRVKPPWYSSVSMKIQHCVEAVAVPWGAASVVLVCWRHSLAQESWSSAAARAGLMSPGSFLGWTRQRLICLQVLGWSLLRCPFVQLSIPVLSSRSFRENNLCYGDGIIKWCKLFIGFI